MSKHFQVIIAGGGITGLSAAWHLAQEGATSILLATGAETPSSSVAPGWISGGQRDNFTRIAQAHQLDFAADLWRFGDHAFDLTKEWAQRHKVPLASSRRLRLIVTAEELTEARLAVAAMKKAGIKSDLLEGKNLSASIWSDGPTPRVLAIQDDGNRGGWIDAKAFHARLFKEVAASRKVTVTESVVKKISGYGEEAIRITLENEGHENSKGKIETVLTDACIVACHLQTGDLIPELSSALIPVADQWLIAIDGADGTGGWNQPGIAWSVFHNHEWGVSLPGGNLLLGGGRILRKWAGFEATSAEVEPKITDYILAQHKKTFPGRHKPESAAAGRDCHPCDELPLIGPMFGEGRILVATGFMGQGLTLGFAAGQCLASLLMTGKCPELPRRLWPERLRSLSEDR